MTLEKLKEYAETIQGNWNGDEGGRGEERADIAGEILEHIKVIEELLNELNN